jgi:hypothetical protein
MFYRMFLLVLLLALGSPERGAGLMTFDHGTITPEAAAAQEQAYGIKGLAALLANPQRSGSRWINGNETIYYAAGNAGMQQLIDGYARLRLRDHVIYLRPAAASSQPNLDLPTGNVQLNFVGGMARHFLREQHPAQTHEPSLTLCLEPEHYREQIKALRMPIHVVVFNSIEPGTATQSLPTPRKAYIAQVACAGESNSIETDRQINVTLWRQGEPEGLVVGQADMRGEFVAAFSEAEIAALSEGRMWLTGNAYRSGSFASPGDPHIPVENLAPIDDSHIGPRPTAILPLARMRVE